MHGHPGEQTGYTRLRGCHCTRSKYSPYLKEKTNQSYFIEKVEKRASAGESYNNISNKGGVNVGISKNSLENLV